MSIKMNFDQGDWENLEKNWTAWWDDELNRPITIIETMNPLFMAGPATLTREFLLEKPVNDVLDYFEPFLSQGNYFHDAFPKYWPNFGPGIAAGFLGGQVFSKPEQHTVWFEGYENEYPDIKDLHFSYRENNIWWNRVKDLTYGAVLRWGNDLSVSHTDLGGNLDIQASFRTSQQLLYDIVDDPEEVERMTKEITTAWVRYYKELYDIIEPVGRGSSNWAALWSPKKTCMHQCDFCYMISPAMFERFVLPDLNDCFKGLEHAAYHLDGKGQIPHVDMLLDLDNLAAIQWIPGGGQPPSEEWLPLLKKLRDGGKRVQIYVTPDGARKIAREIGVRGFALYITTFPPMDKETADDFVKELHKDDISKY